MSRTFTCSEWLMFQWQSFPPPEQEVRKVGIFCLSPASSSSVKNSWATPVFPLTESASRHIPWQRNKPDTFWFAQTLDRKAVGGVGVPFLERGEMSEHRSLWERFKISTRIECLVFPDKLNEFWEIALNFHQRLSFLLLFLLSWWRSARPPCT